MEAGVSKFSVESKKKKEHSRGKAIFMCWSVYDGLLDVEIHHHSMAFPDDFLNYLLFWKLIVNSISV